MCVCVCHCECDVSDPHVNFILVVPLHKATKRHEHRDGVPTRL